MAATKAQINWTGVSFAGTAITRVNSVDIGMGAKLIDYAGDADIYPTVIAMANSEPHASVTTADAAVLMGFIPGASGTFLATLKDAKSAAGGDILFTLANAVFENADTKGQHAQFATGTGSWKAFSSDGSTNPLSFTRA